MNCRQAYWDISLSYFDFGIIYLIRKKQRLLDALSRRSYLAPKVGEAVFHQEYTIFLKPKQFCLYSTSIATLLDLSFFEQICIAKTKDSLVCNIKQSLHNDMFKNIKDLLYFKDHLYILEGAMQLCVLQSCHDFPTIEHFGFNKKLELISQDYWWLQM